jgi:hypothetical protein
VRIKLVGYINSGTNLKLVVSGLIFLTNKILLLSHIREKSKLKKKSKLTKKIKIATLLNRKSDALFSITSGMPLIK